MSESEFPWEREALEFLAQELPAEEPVRMWSNFEFVSNDGQIGAVDALILTRKGMAVAETGRQRTLLREGLRSDPHPAARYRGVPHKLGMRAGYDPTRLNQLVDDLEADTWREWQERLHK